jgi:hypothetical protein
MKFSRIVTYLTLAAMLAGINGCFGDGCSGDDGTVTGPPKPPPDVLSNEYGGLLKLRFANDVIPQFNEAADVNVSVDKQGKMTFGTGTLSYNADENNGQIRIRRVGTITIRPNGKYFKDGDKDAFDVKENSTVNETITMWVWNGASWQQTMNETVTDTWNGGLAFYLNDATADGSTVGQVTGTGEVEWSLHLIPSLVP